MIERKTIIIDNQETNYEVSSDGKVFNKKTGRELKGTYARNEYHSVQLTINGKPKTIMTHRIVAEAFCENPNHYTIVDHIDRNKLNNDYTNLRWVDNSTNVLNAERAKAQKNKIYTGEFDENWKLIYDNYMINLKGQIVNLTSRRVLVPQERNGYIRYNINAKPLSLHKILWEAFMGPIPDGMVVDHIDGNRSNNNLTNLRLISQSENMLNAQIKGHKGQVKVSQYDMNGNFIASYNSIREAANSINGSESAIRQAADRNGTSAGFFWLRDTQNIQEVLQSTTANKPKDNYIGVSQYDTNGNFIAHYASLRAASRDVNSSDSTIRRAADNHRIGKGYYWILDNQDITIEQLINH